MDAQAAPQLHEEHCIMTTRDVALTRSLFVIGSRRRSESLPEDSFIVRTSESCAPDWPAREWGDQAEVEKPRGQNDKTNDSDDPPEATEKNANEDKDGTRNDPNYSATRRSEKL
jgi:hypothetical protein